MIGGADYSWWQQTTLEYGAQVVLNSYVPGSGSIIDFGKAIWEFYKGNMTGGIVNVGVGVLTFATLGFSNGFKTAAALQTGIDPMVFKHWWLEASKQTPWKVVHNFFMSIFSSGGHEVGEAISRFSLETLLTCVFERVLGIFKAARKDKILPVAMSKLAEETSKIYAQKDLLLNYGCAILKGCINIMTNLELDSQRVFSELLKTEALRPYI